MGEGESAEALLARFLALKQAGDNEEIAAERSTLRSQLVERHLGLVRFLAKRFVDRGEPYDDLLQIATLGLINAIDRYQPAFGTQFATFATPTILGELKRYFRDKRWSVHVPRRLKELALAIGGATDALTADLGRTPTPAEIAQRLGVELEAVLEAMEAGGALSPLSLDAGFESEEGTRRLEPSIGAPDGDLELVPERAEIADALDRLPGRERVVVRLRFFEGQTQREVGERLGTSQMQISRIEQRALARLRSLLAPPS